jgi:hypothetical protein
MTDMPMTRTSLMSAIETSWNNLQDFIQTLTNDELTQAKDATGWTVKDHLIHVAIWENANRAMLEGESKREVLEISPEVWEQDDDPINAVLQERYQNMSLNDVLQTLQENHDAMLKKLNTMTEEDFKLPYSHYQPQSTQERAIIDYVAWDTVYHYNDHREWIAAIVGKA